MSFILDALKKSETDRQQKVSPGIADVPTASRPDTTPRWIPVLAALLAVNLAVVLYVVFRPSPTAAPSALAPADDAAYPDTSGNDGLGMQPLPPVGEARQEDPPVEDRRAAPMTDPAISPSDIDADAKSGKRSEPEPATERVADASPAPEPPADTPAPPDEEESWLTLNDLRASGSIDLPEMHIDLHVYSANPSERFVFINMNQYRENATTEEGPRVRRITTEGVLLDYRGSTFLLPRD